MTGLEVAVLFVTMAVLAAVPSLSVVLVASRAAALGFGHGLAAAAGVVLGDLVFVAVAVFGLSVLVAALGGARLPGFRGLPGSICSGWCVL